MSLHQQTQAGTVIRAQVHLDLKPFTHQSITARLISAQNFPYILSVRSLKQPHTVQLPNRMQPGLGGAMGGNGDSAWLSQKCSPPMEEGTKSISQPQMINKRDESWCETKQSPRWPPAWGTSANFSIPAPPRAVWFNDCWVWSIYFAASAQNAEQRDEVRPEKPSQVPCKVSGLSHEPQLPGQQQRPGGSALYLFHGRKKAAASQKHPIQQNVFKYLMKE